MRFNERLLHQLGISKADLATLRDMLATTTATGTMSLQDDDAVDINGGAIDGTTIGATNPAAASFTTIVGTLSTAAQPNITALGIIASLVATSADINGGTIDGTVIGGSATAAGSFTNIVGTLLTAAQPNITSLGTIAALVAGTITNTGLHTHSTTAGITAFATGGQASATLLTTDINEVSTVGTAGDSVKLPVAIAGYKITIINNGANACDVFPNTSDNLGAGVDTAVSLAAGANITYASYNATNWVSV